ARNPARPERTGATAGLVCGEAGTRVANELSPGFPTAPVKEDLMRLLRTALGLALVVALAFAVKVPAADEHHHHGDHFDKCAKACGDCQRACDSCSTHCAHMVAQGKK